MPMKNLNQTGVWVKCDSCGTEVPEAIICPLEHDIKACDLCLDGASPKEILEQFGYIEERKLFTYCRHAPDETCSGWYDDCLKCPYYFHSLGS